MAKASKKSAVSRTLSDTDCKSLWGTYDALATAKDTVEEKHASLVALCKGLTGRGVKFDDIVTELVARNIRRGLCKSDTSGFGKLKEEAQMDRARFLALPKKEQKAINPSVEYSEAEEKAMNAGRFARMSFNQRLKEDVTGEAHVKDPAKQGAGAKGAQTRQTEKPETRSKPAQIVEAPSPRRMTAKEFGEGMRAQVSRLLMNIREFNEAHKTLHPATVDVGRFHAAIFNKQMQEAWGEFELMQDKAAPEGATEPKSPRRTRNK